MNRGVELEPGFKKMKLTDIKGKRKVNVTSLIKTQAACSRRYIHGKYSSVKR